MSLASGRRPEHKGEVLLAKPMALVKLAAALPTGPLVAGRLARPEVIGFSATRTCPELRFLNEALAH